MKKTYVILILILALLSGGFLIFKSNNPLKIVIVGDFEQDRNTFKSTGIIASRIAEKDINDAGGIFGKKVVVKYINIDFSDVDNLFKEVKKENVDILISTLNSENLSKIEAYAKDRDIIFINPNATATSFSKKNNNIYSVLPDDSKEVEKLIGYLEKRNISKDFYIVHNGDNKAYIDSVKEEILARGGNILFEDNWNNKYMLQNEENEEILKKAPVVLVLSPSMEAGFAIQRLKYLGMDNKEIILLSWSMDFNLIEYGGRAVDGIKVISPINISQDNKRYEKLNKGLEEFNNKNSMLASTVYESVILIKEVYEVKLRKHITSKEVLRKYNSCKLWEHVEIKFDEFGDSNRDEFIFQIKEGRFIQLEEY